jgi:hypothetical protein
VSNDVYFRGLSPRSRIEHQGLARAASNPNAEGDRAMTVESRIIAHGITVNVKWTRRGRGYSAELCFGDDDRAVIDAGSMSELEIMVQLAADAAVLARKMGGGAVRVAQQFM